MHILIAYSTKNGCTEECVNLLKRELDGQNIQTVNIEKEPKYKISADNFDIISVGGSVRRGKLSKKLTAFLELNKSVLLETRLGLFFCCGFSANEEYYAENLFDAELTKHAFCVDYFGGEMRMDKAKGLGEKLLVYLVRSHILNGGDNGTGAEGESLPSILEGNISRFADKIRMISENEK